MELQLKNVGMIEEANVKIDGLTVIAGENDTGKSTVGKALFSLLKGRTYAKYDNGNLKNKVEWIFEKISKGELLINNSVIKLDINGNDSIFFDLENSKFKIGSIKFLEAIFIETPFVLNLIETFQSIANANSSDMLSFEIEYPYLTWDLYLKLKQKSKKNYFDKNQELINKISNILNKGTFIYDNNSLKWKFVRDNKEYNLENVATGIKQFGILQMLLKNGYISKERIIVFDEPEVHLHPKWQLEMAKIIVELVKNGVKVLVNSHSPYMIQSLIKYVRDEKVVDKSNFYLAKKEKTYSIIENVNDDLNKIFKLLAEPMNEVFTL